MKKEYITWLKENVGSCLSWSITLAWLIFIYFKIHDGVLPKNLNEFGDFIAGAFAPLAFFWLVRGFYQQGKGLEQNSEALKIQADELRKTTEALEMQVQEMKLALEQQTILSETTKKDLELSKQSFEHHLSVQHISSQPFFHIPKVTASKEDHIYLNVSFSNSRATCREVKILFKDFINSISFGLKHFDLVRGNNSEIYEMKSLIVPDAIQFNKDNNHILFTMKIWYLDSLDGEHYQELHLVIVKANNMTEYEVLVQRPRQNIGSFNPIKI